MFRLDRGGLRLFRIFGIEVFLHWAWLVVAALEVFQRRGAYRSQLWNVAECLTLFGIVLLHEFGHALACRSVGGAASRIVLWPLGGVAFVSPPARPGAVLWSIAAGPMVNLILLLLLLLPMIFLRQLGLPPDAHHYLVNVFGLNALLLGFNMLPLYPLDGGQIVYALLWFAIGRARSLWVVTVIGLAGAVAAVVVAAVIGSWWLVVLAGFGATRAWNGLGQARAMLRLHRAPRRPEVRCPACGAHPPTGEFWRCQCGTAFDTFARGGQCPRCATVFDRAACSECQRTSAFANWSGEEKAG